MTTAALPHESTFSVLVIGAGPAGLMAAERLSAAGV
ncbi:MAG: FAD-dependent monooxygenase, partial [Burkholderiales bacterium]|nr:FAD-dependent monooxygenase [Burkholderiales bacterium]